MTQITIDKSVVEQALEALEANVIGISGRMPKTHEAITSLRQAIEQAKEQEPSNLHVMVGYSSVDNAYFVYEETAPNEYCKIKGPFSNKQVAETAMRDPNAPLIYTQAQPTQPEAGK